MKTATINKLIQEFDAIERIAPSENWDIAFQKKLNKSRMTKSNNVTKFNALMLLLLSVNIAFIWNASKTENTKSVDSRNETFKIISEELLIPNN